MVCVVFERQKETDSICKGKEVRGMCPAGESGGLRGCMHVPWTPLVYGAQTSYFPS